MKTHQMTMKNDEILKSYLEAKNRKIQIGVLADLNCCTHSEIIKILISEGVDPNTLPKPRKKRTPKNRTPEPTPTPKTSTCEVPESPVAPAETAGQAFSLADLDVILDSLKARKKQLIDDMAVIKLTYDELIAEHQEQIRKISDVLNHIAGGKDNEKDS